MSSPRGWYKLDKFCLTSNFDEQVIFTDKQVIFTSSHFYRQQVIFTLRGNPQPNLCQTVTVKMSGFFRILPQYTKIKSKSQVY